MTTKHPPAPTEPAAPRRARGRPRGRIYGERVGVHLRIPVDLHARLVARSEQTGRALGVHLIQMLERELGAAPADADGPIEAAALPASPTEVRLRNLMLAADRFPTIKAFCEAIGISPGYWGQVKAKVKNVGERLARRIEERLALPQGWMDTPHPEEAHVTRRQERAFETAFASLAPSVRARVIELVLTLASQTAGAAPGAAPSEQTDK